MHSIEKKRRAVLAWSLLAVAGFMSLAGCGGADEWPSSVGDYAQIKAGRGLAMQWGVQFDVEQTEGDTVAVNQTGSLGTTPEESAAEKEIQLGNVTITLKADGQQDLELLVNQKSYGRIRIGNKVKVSPDRVVSVNKKERAPK